MGTNRSPSVGKEVISNVEMLPDPIAVLVDGAPAEAYVMPESFRLFFRGHNVAGIKGDHIVATPDGGVWVVPVGEWGEPRYKRAEG